MKRIAIVVFLLMTLSVGAYLLARAIFPASIQIWMASVAGCDFDEQRMRAEDARFEGGIWWEYPLMYALRFEMMLFPGEFIVSDSLNTNASVFHILLFASDHHKGDCDDQIIPMIERYAEVGAPIDHFSDDGFTALQESVISKNIPVLNALLSSGADPGLGNRSGRPAIAGKSSMEMAEFFAAKKEYKYSAQSLAVLIALEGYSNASHAGTR